MTATKAGEAVAVSNGLLDAFSNRKIATKIAIGFALVLAITIGISVMAYVNFGSVQDSFMTYSQHVKVVGLARDIDREFLAYRRFVREFAVTGEEADVAVAGKAHALLSGIISDALAEIKNPDRLARIRDLSEKFGLYGKDFDKMVGLRRDLDKIAKDVLDPTGLKLRTSLEELQRSDVDAGTVNFYALVGEGLKHALLARLNVNKVLGRHDAAATEGATKAFADLKSVMNEIGGIAKAGSAGKLAGEIKGLLSAYQQGFEASSRDSHDIEMLVDGEMKKLAEEIADNAQSVKQTGVADEQRIERETEGLIGSTKQLVLMLAAGGVVLGIALAWLVGRGISVPIRRIGDVLLALANGNKTIEVPYADRGDEVGDNARAAKTFKENLVRIEMIEAQQKESEQHNARQRKADMRKLADDFEGAVGNVVNAVSVASAQLESSASTLTRTAERAQQVTTTVASASEEASANVQSVASATEELTSSVNEISRQVQDSARIANEAVSQAHRTNERINQLALAANRIGDVVELINTIAGQTNLLALNATIEAARAGEAGRGFAVVASEVKALAEQTAKATGEISQQIAGMQAATAESVGSIKEIGATIAQMSEISSTIAAAVEEQGAATQEISRNVQQAAQGTTQVSSNIIDVQRGAGETGSASAQVLSAAQSLSSEAGRLKTEVARFLNSVRAA